MNPVNNETHMYDQHPEQQFDASTAIETNNFQVFDMKLQSEIHPIHSFSWSCPL